MRFIRISPSQLVNLTLVTHIEIYEGEKTHYTTIHFASGKEYRCTEEEAEVLLPLIEQHILQSHTDVSPH